MSTYDDVIREQFADYEKEGRNVFFMRKDLKKNKKILKNRTDLDNSKFLATDLTEANLSNSNLYKSIFDFTTLIGANLSKANLEGSTFLKGTNLNDANLKGAILKDAVFKHAHVDGADFEGAVLDGAVFDPKHVYGLDRANFKKTVFEGTPGYGNNYTGKSIEKEKEDKRKEERREYKKSKKIENEKLNTVLFIEPTTNATTSKYIYKTPMDEIREFTKLVREEEEKKRKEEEKINQIIEENKRTAHMKTMNTSYQSYPQDIISELFEQMNEEQKNNTGKGVKKRNTKKK